MAAASTFSRGRANLRNASVTFLAPPTEMQQSFSNANLSVLRLSVCMSRLRGGGGGGVGGISQKCFSNFSSF